MDECHSSSSSDEGSVHGGGAAAADMTSLCSSRHLQVECKPQGTGRGQSPMRDFKIPSVIWGVMKLSCIFHERRLVVNRCCYHCQVRNVFRKSKSLGDSIDIFEKEMWRHNFDFSGQNYHEEDYGQSGETQEEPMCSTGTGESASREKCTLCNSYWWDYFGSVGKYTDEDIGVGAWNHVGSWFISLLIVFGAIAVIVYDTVYYLGALWGQQSQLIHVISYGTFMVSLVLYPLLNVISKMRLVAQTSVPQLSWSTALEGRYIAKRLQYLGIPQKGIPGKIFLLIGMACAVFHTGYRGEFYLRLCGRFSWHSGVSVLCGGVILVIFVCFQYLVRLMKLSFQRHFRLIESYIKCHQGDLQSCRQILGSAFQEFNCYRKLVAVYMTLFIPTLTWAVTTHVTRQYFLRSNMANFTAVSPSTGRHADDNSSNNTELYIQFENHINILIWEEILMFFGLSVWAVSGIDANYMWRRLRLRVLMIKRERGTTQFWRKLTHFLDLIYERYDRINITMVFCLIGFFMALEFGNHQKMTFVIQEPYCHFRETNF